MEATQRLLGFPRFSVGSYSPRYGVNCLQFGVRRTVVVGLAWDVSWGYFPSHGLARVGDPRFVYSSKKGDL